MWEIIKKENEINIIKLIEWSGVSLFLAILFAIIDVLLFLQLFKIRIDKKKKYLTIVVYSILRFLSVLFIPYPIYRASNLIFAIGVFRIFFKENWERCIYGEIVNSISIILLEGLFAKLYCMIFPVIKTYETGIYDYKYKLAMGTTIVIVRLIIYFIIEKKNIVINLNNNLSKENKIRIILVSSIGLLIILFTAMQMAKFIDVLPYSVFLLTMFTLSMCFYLSIRDLFRINKMEESDEKINNLETYNKTLQIMYDSIRGFRHDYNNFIQALNGYAQTENIDGIKSMMKSVMNECVELNSMNILDPKIINNSAVYSIITNKYYLAKKNGINMNIEIMTNIEEIEIPTYELCRILGILLDNAIEASKKCDEKIINVVFKKDIINNRKLVIIENSCEIENIDIEKLFEKGYSTKKEDLNKHGLGLWNVRKILNKFSNLNLYTTKNKLFSQQLEIY